MFCRLCGICRSRDAQYRHHESWRKVGGVKDHTDIEQA